MAPKSRVATHSELYVLPGEEVNGHWHGVEFLTEAQLADRRQTGNNTDVEKALSLREAEFRGKFWLTDNWEILSTAEVIRRCAEGASVKGRTGPHDTEVGASNCADAAWEAPGE